MNEFGYQKQHETSHEKCDIFIFSAAEGSERGQWWNKFTYSHSTTNSNNYIFFLLAVKFSTQGKIFLNDVSQ